MADNLVDKSESLKCSHEGFSSKLMPILDNAIEQSHNCEELLQVALVGVLTVVVSGVLGSLFKK